MYLGAEIEKEEKEIEGTVPKKLYPELYPGGFRSFCRFGK